MILNQALGILKQIPHDQVFEEISAIVLVSWRFMFVLVWIDKLEFSISHFVTGTSASKIEYG